MARPVEALRSQALQIRMAIWIQLANDEEMRSSHFLTHASHPMLNGRLAAPKGGGPLIFSPAF